MHAFISCERLKNPIFCGSHAKTSARILAAMTTHTPLHPILIDSPTKARATSMRLQPLGFARRVARQSLPGCTKIASAHITCGVTRHFQHGSNHFLCIFERLGITAQITARPIINFQNQKKKRSGTYLEQRDTGRIGLRSHSLFLLYSISQGAMKARNCIW